jgi:AbiV family abortive infection protein
LRGHPVEACVSNGKKVVEDASLLFDWGRFSTALALAVLALKRILTCR